MTSYDYFIPYKNCGGVIVDWDFQSIIHCFNWYDNGTGYARAHIPNEKQMLMHKMLTQFNKYTDHINGKRNDNRLSNLREVSRIENNRNKESHRNGKLVGTSYESDRNKWRATYKNKTIGRYNTEIEAHIAFILYTRGV
jgi:hypothetical protein